MLNFIVKVLKYPCVIKMIRERIDKYEEGGKPRERTFQNYYCWCSRRVFKSVQTEDAKLDFCGL